jgi:hypothetical protein
VTTEPETEIVSDAPSGRSRRKAAKKATELESVIPGEVVGTVGEPVVQRLRDQAQPPDEEIRELTVEKLPLNPRMAWASFEEPDGRKQVVLVFVGINRNFRPRMKLRAQRGSTENAPWKLVGRQPRLPGRW